VTADREFPLGEVESGAKWIRYRLHHRSSGPANLLLASTMLVIAAAVLRPSACAAAEQIVCRTSGSVQTCKITEPKVTQHETTYPTIVFHPGDFVTVHAGGCVQSGGSGQTWHRYVNPSGPNSDHLYHGLISYPGSGGLIRFAPASQTTAGWTFQIPKNVQGNLSLILGFEDDNYSDNGYWGHDRDNGPNGQCPIPPQPGGEPAWVTLVISPTGTTSPNMAMDLISDTVDPNNLPFNPWWAYEKGVGRPPGGPAHPDPDIQCGLRYIDPDNVDLGINLVGNQCTTQSPSVNQGKYLNGELCRHAAVDGVLAGHLNWFVSTYTGKIQWQDFSGSELNTGDLLNPGDDDYNFTLAPDSGTGLTVSRPAWIGLEFDSDEVVDRIDKGWWNDFHNTVNAYGGAGGGASLDIAYDPAIAIGVMGLDSEHGAYTELHPLYGLAIRINTDNAPATDDWVFLARNFGNEGYCSDGNLTVPELKTLSFFIPRANAIGDDPANPTALNELYSTNDNNSVALSFVPGGAIISFDVGNPRDQTVYSGHVQFHWQLSGGPSKGSQVLPGVKNVHAAAPTSAAAAAKAHLGVVKGAPVNEADAAELSAKVLRGFPPAVQPAVNALLAKQPVVVHAVPVHRVVRAAPPLIHKAPPIYIRATNIPDPVRSAREAQLLKLYCDTYPGGKSANMTARSCARPVTKRQ
jgi:hypothetical protein